MADSAAAPEMPVAYVADAPAADAPWVGVLYESSEWSDFKLAQEIAARGCPVRMVDMERPDAVGAALACNLLVSRVFASALARGACRLARAHGTGRGGCGGARDAHGKRGARPRLRGEQARRD